MYVAETGVRLAAPRAPDGAIRFTVTVR